MIKPLKLPNIVLVAFFNETFISSFPYNIQIGKNRYCYNINSIFMNSLNTHTSRKLRFTKITVNKREVKGNGN